MFNDHLAPTTGDGYGATLPEGIRPQALPRIPSPIAMRQGHFFNADHVISQIVVPEECPNINLVIAPCRSGTVGLGISFAQVGPSFYQPLKTVIRAGEPPFVIPAEGNPVFMKETFGPYHIVETRFEPIDLLLRAGVPIDKIKLVVLMREPISCYGSWLDQFEGTEVGLFREAYWQTLAVYRRARSYGIPTTPLIYESFKHGAEPVMAWLCHRLNMPYSPNLINWDNPNTSQYIHHFGTEYGPEAAPVAEARLLTNVRAACSLRYVERKDSRASLDEAYFVDEHVRPLYLQLASDFATEFGR